VPKQQSTREAISDGVITARVKAALLADPTTANHEIHVETLASIVQLSGFAETTIVRDRALQLARNVAGVRQVNDSLDIRRTD
jgi:hyperosmotically inducible periplasmic protein